MRRFELSQFNYHVRTEIKDTKDQARLERLRDEVKELRRRREQLGDLLIRFGDESREDLLASLRMTADVSSIWVRRTRRTIELANPSNTVAAEAETGAKQQLIGGDLPWIYEKYLNFKAGVSRPPDGGPPGGPTIRFMQAVLDKFGIEMTEEGLVPHIKSYKRRSSG